LRGSASCEVRFSTSSQPDKNPHCVLHACVQHVSQVDGVCALRRLQVQRILKHRQRSVRSDEIDNRTHMYRPTQRYVSHVLYMWSKSVFYEFLKMSLKFQLGDAHSETGPGCHLLRCQIRYA